MTIDLKKMNAARKAAYEKRKSLGEKVNRTPPEKFKDNPTSWSLAIACRCWECQGAEHDFGGRNRIRNCEKQECSLFNFRPYKHPKGTSKINSGIGTSGSDTIFEDQ